MMRRSAALAAVMVFILITISGHTKFQVFAACTARDISVSQTQTSSSGIPGYTVQIVNTCVSGCPPSNIHVHCGDFTSARLVNPITFKRLSTDDCLVNGGRPLSTIRFDYYSTFMFPISFKSATFC